MNPKRRLQKAIHEYEQFILSLQAFTARHVTTRTPDPPIEPIVEVPRREALNCFLKIHPEFSDLHHQLLEVRDGQEMFFFAKKRWRDTCSERH